MAIVRWEPIRELSSLQNEMNRLFSTAFDKDETGGMRRWVPAMDLFETEDSFILRADLPGMKESNVKVEIEDNVLTVSGERKSEHEERNNGYYRLERGFGSFARSLTLPKGINPEGVQASFDSGVLEVRIPKPEERKPKRVEIGVSGKNGKATIEGSVKEK